MDKLQWADRKWLRRRRGGGGGDNKISSEVVDLHPPPYRSSACENGEACSNSKTKTRQNESSKKMNENGRLLIALSSKEKEEDFMIIKGCKPSQRPKKRAKSIQRTILLLSPGEWLSDVCRERYQVKEEKKTCKKKLRGLKAMEMELE